MPLQRTILTLLLIALLLAGCQSLQLPNLFATGKNGPADLQPTPTLEPFLQTAVSDLAKRTGLRAGEITVTGVVAQAFSEEAFRCEGTKEQVSSDAAQETISGHTILLDAGGRQYVYHSGDGKVFFCREAD